MDAFFALTSLAAFLCSAFFSMRIVHPRTRVEGFLLFSLFLASFIVFSGYLLSACKVLSMSAWWAGSSAIIFAIVIGIASSTPRLRAAGFRKLVIPHDIEARIVKADRSSFSVRILIFLAITVIIGIIANLSIVMMLEPATPDVLMYHLARMAHYLQQNDLGYIGAHFWAEDVYPKVSAILLGYAYIVSGKLSCLTQIVQFAAYLVCMVATYGICRLLGSTRKASAFAAGIFGILTICLMEASTAQNDLILTAFVGCLIYFLLEYKEHRKARYLAFAALAFALAVGVKATFLVMLPPLAIIVAFTCRRDSRISRVTAWRHAGVGFAALAIALIVIALPAGYWENIQRFGDPFGPKSVRAQYTQEAVSPLEFIRAGSLNTMRYAVDFVTLDGADPIPGARHIQGALTGAMRFIPDRLGIDLQSPQGARDKFPFEYQKSLVASENTSSWGVLGFLLICPVVLITLLRRRVARGYRVFAAAAVLYGLTMAFLIPYDPFHGRFFITGALFSLPPLAGFISERRSKRWDAYLAVVMWIGCITALSASVLRTGTPLLSTYYNSNTLAPSAFSTGKWAQSTRECAGLQLMTFDVEVPPNAIVAIDVTQAIPEYLFFGDQLSRRIITIRSFLGERRPIPADAEYLIYDEASPSYSAKGIPLTNSFFPRMPLFVRKLK